MRSVTSILSPAIPLVCKLDRVNVSVQIFRRTTELYPLADVNIPVQVLRRQISDAVAAEVNLCVLLFRIVLTRLRSDHVLASNIDVESQVSCSESHTHTHAKDQVTQFRRWRKNKRA